MKIISIILLYCDNIPILCYVAIINIWNIIEITWILIYFILIYGMYLPLLCICCWPFWLIMSKQSKNDIMASNEEN